MNYSFSALLVFHSQQFWGLLFLALEPWARCLVWGWDPLLLLSSDICSQDMPPDFYPLYVGAGLYNSVCLPLLRVLKWLFHILVYRTSVQLDLGGTE